MMLTIKTKLNNNHTISFIKIHDIFLKISKFLIFEKTNIFQVITLKSKLLYITAVQFEPLLLPNFLVLHLSNIYVISLNHKQIIKYFLINLAENIIS